MTNKKIFRPPFNSPYTQKGVVLMVGLIMVLLITIVSLAAVRGTGLQESMAGNMRDRNVAFQAAESALRAGEARLGLDVKVLPDFNCTEGNCLYFAYVDGVGFQPQKAVELWDKTKWEEHSSEIDLALSGVAQKPRVILEAMGEDTYACAANSGSAIGVGGSFERCFPFRVTARGYGASANTVVIVQSSFMRKE